MSLINMIKSILFFLFLVVSLMIFSQENLEIQTLKETLIKDKQLYEINLKIIIEEIKKDSIVLNQLTMENKDYLTDLSILKVSDKNLKVYNSLIQKKLFQPIDFLSRKTKKFSRSLNEQFNLTLLDNYFVENQTLYYYFVDSNYKASILKSIGLDSKNYKNFLRLDIKEVYPPKNTTSDQFLDNLTGINNNYFSLTEKIDSLKAKIKRLNENLIEKGQKKKLLIEEYKTKERVTENKIKLIEQEIKNEIITQENSKKYPCKSINGVDIYLGPLLEKSFRNGDIIREARTPGEWSDFIKNKIPAYKYEGFDSDNAKKGLFYNYYAFQDSREISPIGFHKLNILDFIYLENHKIGESKKVTKDCYCKDGMKDAYTYCEYCKHWTKDQKKYNICPKCNNKERIYKGKEKCSLCKGKRQYSDESCEVCENLEKTAIILSSDFSKITNSDDEDDYINQYEKPFFELTLDNNGYLSYEGDNTFQDYDPIKYSEIKIAEYRFIICRDRINNKKMNNSIPIGEIELQNSFLRVDTFQNGDKIKYIDDKVEWELAIRNGIPAYCYYNNDKSNPCFYNKHVLKDKRRLIPNEWRLLTSQDIIYIESYYNKELSFLNGTIPSQIKKPEGFRNEFGEFIQYKSNSYNRGMEYVSETDYFNFNFNEENYDYETRNYFYKINSNFFNTGGYILCVREKSSRNINPSITINDNPFDRASSGVSRTNGFGNDFANGEVIEGGEGDGTFCDNTPTNLNTIINLLKNNVPVTKPTIANVTIKIKADGSVSSIMVNGLGGAEESVARKIKEIAMKSQFTKCNGKNKNSRSYIFPKIVLKQD